MLNEDVNYDVIHCMCLHLIIQKTKNFWEKKRLDMKELTKTERLLLYGLKQFNMPSEEAAAIAVYLEEDDQVLMIDYLVHHLNATHQEIMNEFGRILELRKNITK